ncbi:unnamed protein product [Miscanthus lutarioriparius]|uniref:60S acidic ribosomal protein P2 n=1 Tax=Miscanthus lutarioriparius TaxID=422564 RepID=A0A811QY55_9POAL|nr:unnamed protein product [Miscanthus lutarioriparius]
MKFVAAYLLAVLAGNNDPSVEDLKTVLESVGAEIDTDKMEHLLSQLSGKDITELIAAGREKFASFPSGGGAEKKEEKVEEKEESDDDMGFSLFD